MSGREGLGMFPLQRLGGSGNAATPNAERSFEQSLVQVILNSNHIPIALVAANCSADLLTRLFTFNSSLHCSFLPPTIRILLSNNLTNPSEENVDLAPAPETTRMLTTTTLPYNSGVEQNTAEGVIWRDFRGESHLLPEEVLIEIIHQAASNRRINKHSNLLSDPTLFQSLNACRGVCKRWKQVIDNAPALWAFLSADTPSPAVVQNAISKSRNAPLVISYGAGMIELERFIEIVAPQMGRCKALWTATESAAPALQTLFDIPCPSLEELHIHNYSKQIVRIDRTHANTEHLCFTLWALRHNAHAIKILSLRGAEGWKTGLNLTNLRELELGASSIHVDDLIEFLGELLLLRILVIDSPDEGIAQRVVHESIVKLEFLARIELQKVTSSFAHGILSRINPSSLKQLVICISRFDSPLFPLGDVGTGYQALLLSLMEAQGTLPIPIDIATSVQLFAVADDQTGRGFKLSEHWPDGPVHFSQSLLNISGCWSFIPNPSLTLLLGMGLDHRIGIMALTQEILKPMMDIAGVSNIEVGKIVIDVHHLYRRLSYAVVGEDQSRRWLLPRLATIEIVGHEGQDKALVQMLERRHAAAVTVNGDTVAPLPFPWNLRWATRNCVSKREGSNRLKSTMSIIQRPEPRMRDSSSWNHQSQEKFWVQFREEAIELAEQFHDVNTVTKVTRSHYPRISELMMRPRERENPFNKNHQLPNELLSEIIRRAASNPRLNSETHLLSDPTLFQSLGSYRGVCKRWRSLIDGTPALWAFLSADKPSSEVVKRAIDKSGNALVVISYGAGKMEREEFINMVAPQMHRCRALWMNGEHSSGSAPILQSLLDTPCPYLEELHYYFTPGWTVNTAENVWRNEVKLPCFNMWALQNNAQRLRALGFSRLVGWRRGLGLTNLRELKLQDSELTLGQLVESLTELPLLRSLLVDRPAGVRDQDIRRDSTVELAFLTRIELLNVTASFAHATLSRITPSSLKQLAISVLNFDLPVLRLEDLGTHYQILLLSLIEAQGTVPIPIRVDGNSLAISVPDYGASRQFELSGVQLCATEDRSRCAKSIYDLTQWWGSVLAPSFSLRWGMDPVFDNKIANMSPEILKPLMDITAVVKIQVGVVYGIQHLYQRLSYAVRGRDESRRWLLPQLTVLEIAAHHHMDGILVRMLRDRYAAIASAHGDSGVPLPFAMMKLVRGRGETLKPDPTEEIRSIVGEEHFRLETKPLYNLRG
ncbi:hypothetical protein M407DRAFT_226372 [Tulasnella calospora MUT 4182]|uniref:F-box domain-containing protein n=1 Tax=Tulasnella calospora MUT 4182 TaxID=1051891 RepID=A0A0C3QQK3_9AGAM|nr:hypothetical protein M407DRAFT_226372 [Tulasnella calospora MUT 4182]